MRYVILKKEGASPETIIWTKSQHRIPVKHEITRECSHKDYLRNNNIPFARVSSIGSVYYNPQNNKTEISVLSWDTPAPPEDSDLAQKEAVLFFKQHPELQNDIQEDWNEYKALQKYAQELLAKRK